jgi:hypothetical protein
MSESCESQNKSALREAAEAVELKSPIGESQLALALVDDVQNSGENKGLGDNSLPKIAPVPSIASPVDVSDKRMEESAPQDRSTRIVAPGMKRHKLTIAVTAVLALGIFGLNLLDLKPLLTQDGKIDRNFVFSATKPMAELSPNCSYARGAELKEGLIPVDEFSLDGQKVGFADANGHIVIPPKFVVAKNFSQGRAAVKFVGAEKWGFIDHSGKLVIPAIYTEINGFHYGLASVKNDDGSYLIDKDGKVCFSGKNQEIDELPGGMYIVRNSRTKLAGLLKSAQWVVPQENTDVSDLTTNRARYDGYASTDNGSSNSNDEVAVERDDLQYFQTRKNGISSIIDSTGKVYFTDRSDGMMDNVSNGHLLTSNGEHLGFRDLKGAWIIAPKYEHATAYDKIIGVMQDGKISIIDGAGNPIKTLPIDNLVYNQQTYKWLSDGMALFKRNHKYGYLDASGREVIAPKYANASPFEHGIAKVYEGSRWHFIDKRGKVVSKNDYVQASVFNGESAAVSIPGMLYGPLEEWPRELSQKQNNLGPIVRGAAELAHDFESSKD